MLKLTIACKFCKLVAGRRIRSRHLKPRILLFMDNCFLMRSNGVVLVKNTVEAMIFMLAYKLSVTMILK